MRKVVQGGVSAFVAVLCVGVLLQQFAVWPLTVVTGVLLPLLAGGGAVVALRDRHREEEPS